jgi:N-acetylneuraminate synthase
MKALANGARNAFLALGTGGEGRSEVESGSMAFRRSLYVVRDMAAGEIFTDQNVRIIRPGYGLAPKHLPAVLGKTASRQIRRGTRLSWDDIAAK